MSKLYSLKKFVGSITTGMAFVWALLCVQPLKAQPDSLRPDIRFFTPTSGSQGTLIDIVGTNFTTPANVFFGGTPAASVQVLSDSLIRAKVGAGSTGAVTVITQFGGDSLGGFTFIRDTARPRIRSFTPTSGRTGTTVDIAGIHFRNTIDVSFGGVRAFAFSVLSDSLIKAVVGNGASGAVRVTTTSGTDSLGGFTFIRDTTRPLIEFFTPTSGKTGTVVSIIGSRFSTTTSVSFGGVPAASFTVIADSLISAKVGSGATGAVRVTTLFGTDSLKGFTYIRDTLPPDSFPPVIASFTPTSGRTGTTVFIFGKHFTGATSVSFGNVPALSYVVFADTGIRAVVGNGASGAVRVKTPFGIDSLNGFTFIRDTTARPKIAFFTPTSGKTGTIVEIIGKGFKQTVGVRFGGVPATLFAVLSDSLIWAKVGKGASGFVSVSTPTGTDSLCCFKLVGDSTRPLPPLVVTNERLAVAPNPTNGYTIVTHPAIAENAQLKITDVAGNVVRTIRVSPNVSQTQLSLGGVKPGVYKLSWGDGAKWISQTLLVQ